MRWRGVLEGCAGGQTQETGHRVEGGYTSRVPVTVDVFHQTRMDVLMTQVQPAWQVDEVMEAGQVSD